NVHHRVIADHLRSTSFLIADGVLPSSDGRGYVLRRIMRRAMRHAHLLGVDAPMMHRLVPALVKQMGIAFPELGRAQSLIEETLELEENRFRKTLDRGLGLLDDALDGLPDGAELPGDTAFKLYDTYGFPLDLTQDALREKGRTVDTEGFDAAMAEQKAKARAAWSGSGESADAAVWFDVADKHGATEFLGYETETAEGQVVSLVADGAEVAEIAAGASGWVVLNQTPFYAESGGQVGDHGEIRAEGAVARVTDVKKMQGVFAHQVDVTEGVLKPGVGAELIVSHSRRSGIRANHSATHLLHEALRGHLGDHVAQRGSLNDETRLRFDFSHSKGMSATEIKEVEAEVNEYIRQNSPVTTRLMTPDEAREQGAQALFGEKYGDEVRVVSMGTRDGKAYSMELCGGTHVAATGDIGLLVITGESASSAGVRRIEALTGAPALAHLNAQDQALTEVANVLKTRPDEAAARAQALLDERKALQAEIADLRKQVALGGSGSGGVEVKEISGVKLIAQALTGVSPKDLRGLIDEHKKSLGSGAVLLIADAGGKAAVAAGVTEDLLDRVSAVSMVQAAAVALGGKGGGGRPDMAQAGGPDASKAPEAIAAVEAIIGG
ncbi:MAG: alanine--tRNA ligase, partial [Pikeienuella sp.]